jgi:hypothetical protein
MTYFGALKSVSDWGKPKFSERRLIDCHLVQHKSQMYWNRIEIGHPRGENGY